jgi:hypothetical protein
MKPFAIRIDCESERFYTRQKHEPLMSSSGFTFGAWYKKEEHGRSKGRAHFSSYKGKNPMSTKKIHVLHILCAQCVCVGTRK